MLPFQIGKGSGLTFSNDRKKSKKIKLTLDESILFKRSLWDVKSNRFVVVERNFTSVGRKRMRLVVSFLRIHFLIPTRSK